MNQSASINVSARSPATNIVDSLNTGVGTMKRMNKSFKYVEMDVKDSNTFYGIIWDYHLSSTHGLCAKIFCNSSPFKYTMVPIYKKIKLGSLVCFNKSEYEAKVMRDDNWELSKVGLTHIENHKMYNVTIKGQEVRLLLKYYEVVKLRKTMECHEFDHPIIGKVKDFEKRIQNTQYRTIVLNLSSKGGLGFKVICSVDCSRMLVEEVILREDMPEDPEQRKEQWKEIHHWMEVQKKQIKWELVGPLKVVNFGKFYGVDAVFLKAGNQLKAKNALHYFEEIKGYLSPVESDANDDRMLENEFPNGFLTLDQNGLVFILNKESLDIPLKTGELHKFIARGHTQSASKYK